MTSLALKKNIYLAIEKIDDTNLLKAVYTILEKQIESDHELTPAQKKELDRRRSNHINGNSKSYSWREVKKAALEKVK